MEIAFENQHPATKQIKCHHLTVNISHFNTYCNSLLDVIFVVYIKKLSFLVPRKHQSKVSYVSVYYLLLLLYNYCKPIAEGLSWVTSSNLYTAAADVEDLPLVRDLPPRPPVLRLPELTCIHVHRKHVDVETQLPIANSGSDISTLYGTFCDT